MDLSLVDDAYVVRVKKFAEQIRSEQTKLTKAKTDLAASQLSKQDIAVMATELRERFFAFTSAAEWTQQDRKKVLTETVEKITFKEDGSVEFVMKGGLLLEQLSDGNVATLYLESTLDSLKNVEPAKIEEMKRVVRKQMSSGTATPHPASLAGKRIAKFTNPYGQGFM